MTGEMYFGSPGGLFEIPHPRGGVQTTRIRPTSTFQTASGGVRTGKTLNGKRRFTLNWRQLWYETYVDLLQYDQGHMGPGPFVLHDPGQVNWLRVNQSSATSLQNDTGEFTLVPDQTAMYDNYTRTGSGGWNTATSGHVWVASTPTTAPFSTNGTTGRVALSSVVAAVSSYGGLYLPGSSGAYASTPDNAALDITGDIDLRADVTLEGDWRPAFNRALVGKWTSSGNQKSYIFQILSGGFLHVAWSTNGTAEAAIVSSAPVPIPAGGRLALRGVLDVNNGAGGTTATFYTAPSLAGPWTQLGTPVTIGGTISIFSSTAIGAVGAIDAGTNNVLTGVVHAAEVRNGIDGTVVANPDFDAQAAGTTSFADSAGRTWTLNGTSSVVSGYAAAEIRSVGTRNCGLRVADLAGDIATTPDNAALDITGDIDLRVDLTMTDWSNRYTNVVCKWNQPGQQSYLLQIAPNGAVTFVWSTDGTNAFSASSTATLPFTNGARGAVRATMDVNNGAGGWTAVFYTAPTIAGPWTQLGNPVSSAGTISFFSSTTQLSVHGFAPGRDDASYLVHAIEVRNGIDGTAVANPDFAAQAPGTTSFADPAGRTWTVGGSAAIACGDDEWDVVTDISIGITPAGGNIAAGIDMPFLADSTLYRALLTFTTSGTVVASIYKRKDQDLTTVLPGTTVPGLTATTSIRMRVRRADGRYRIYVWDKNLAESTAWTASFADTTVLVPGTFRLVGYRLIGNTDSSAVLTFDNLTLSYIDLTSSLSSSAALVDRGPRSLAWTLGSAFTDIAGTTAVLILDSPSPSWPGIPVITGLPLMFSFTARGGGADPIVTLTPQLTWYNTAGAVISTTSGTPVATSSSAWSVVSVTATPPGGAAYVLAKVEFTSGESAGSIVYMDRFQMERGSAITTWRPGTGIMPVTMMSLNEQWPWMASDYRESPVMVLQEVGA